MIRSRKLFGASTLTSGIQDKTHRTSSLRPVVSMRISTRRSWHMRNSGVACHRILRHLGLWEQGVRVFPARAPPEPDEWVIEPCYDDPFPCLPRRILLSGRRRDYDTEPVMA